MKTSRFLLTLGLAGLAYAPTVSAKFLSDLVPGVPRNPTATEATVVPPSATGGSVTTPSPVALPAGTLTRAEFTRMIVERLYPEGEINHCYWDIASTLPPSFTLLYTDVPATSSYGNVLCVALRDGLARGYKDGSFRPNDAITFAEAAKVISRAYVLAPYADNERTAWYVPHVVALTARMVVPTSVVTFRDTMTVEEVEGILSRLDEDITWEPSRSYDDLVRASQPRPVTTPSTNSAPITPMTNSAIKPKDSSASSEPAKKEEEKDAPWYKIF